MREGVTWFSQQGAATLAVTVTVPTTVYAVTWDGHDTPATMSAGASVSPNLSFTNDGSLTWEQGGANPVRLSYHWRSGACLGGGVVVWDGARAGLPADVSQGGTVIDLAMQVEAPASAGTFCLAYDLMREGVTWFSQQGAVTLAVTVTVPTTVYAVTWDGHDTSATMNAGASVSPNLSFTNDGSLTWEQGGANPVRLSYHWRSGACPDGGVVVWDGARAGLPGDVSQGGAVIDLAVQVKAPASAGTFCLAYDLVREGVTWFSQQGAATLAVTVTVN